uniref:Uncharacterized protein n=1 Tax=Oryza brachyantha TaxID=4533 RepID=J3L7X8_ORYBR
MVNGASRRQNVGNRQRYTHNLELRILRQVIISQKVTLGLCSAFSRLSAVHLRGSIV